MGSTISSAYNKIGSTEENENELNIEVISKKFGHVIHSYVNFLRNISRAILESCTNDVEREKRKFNSVRKELLVFLSEHIMYFTVKAIELSSNDGSILYTLTLDYSDNYEHSLNLDDIPELDLKMDSFKEVPTTCICLHHVEEKIIRKIKVALNKSAISDDDIQLFSENNFLVNKTDDKNKCSNYKELIDYINRRGKSYCERAVSAEHINMMSFKFQGSIKDYDDEKSCCVCLEDYEKDQEICRLPCNHFCCKKCTEKMFAIPEDGSIGNFQCPICRDDCT